LTIAKFSLHKHNVILTGTNVMKLGQT